MMRRLFVTSLLCLPMLAQAGLLDAVSGTDASAGLKQALEQGASAAVANLGAADGFWANDRFRIPLPAALKQIEPVLRMTGKGAALDEMNEGLNRAAEQAVALAKPLLLNAVKQMSVQDAKGILTGGEDSVTQYFRSKTSSPLSAQFLPVVRKVTGRMKLAEQYNQLAGRGAALGVIKAEDANVENYVTRLALDALFVRIGEEEKAIRANPAAAVGGFARKVFGAMGR